MYCRFCGKQIDELGGKFCPYCGQAVSEEKNETASDTRSVPKDQSDAVEVTGVSSQEKVKSADVAANTPKRIHKKHNKKKFIGLCAVLGVVLIAVLIAIGGLHKGKASEHLMIVDNNSLVLLDSIDDEKGVAITAGFANSDIQDRYAGTALAAAGLSSTVRYSADGKYAFYPDNYSAEDRTYTLMCVDLEQAKGRKQRVSTQLVAPDIEEWYIFGDVVIYLQCITTTDGYTYPLGYYDISAGSSFQIANDSSVCVVGYGDHFAVSDNGKCLIYGEGDAVYFYDTVSRQKKSLAVDAEVYWCTPDLSEIVYTIENEVYLATTQDGEITSNDCLVTMNEKNPESGNFVYTDKQLTIYSDWSEDDRAMIVCQDGESATCEAADIMPLWYAAGIRSNALGSLASLPKTSGVFGLQYDYDHERISVLGSDLQPYQSSVRSDEVISAAWDPDHSILYLLFWTENSGYLYAYPMEQGTITNEVLIAKDCGYDICYDSTSKTLFYFEDYDYETSSGTLCAITEGEYQISLVERAYTGHATAYPETGSIYGLQFDDATPYILCWSDVKDGIGNLYALDMSADDPVIPLGSHVCLDSWGVYNDDILFIGNFEKNNGGTLFRFDGKDITREREAVMAVVTNTSRYSYMELE